MISNIDFKLKRGDLKIASFLYCYNLKYKFDFRVA